MKEKNKINVEEEQEINVDEEIQEINENEEVISIENIEEVIANESKDSDFHKNVMDAVVDESEKIEDIPINEELDESEVPEIPEELEGARPKKESKKKIGPKTTKTDIMNALRDGDELRERRSSEREEKSLKWHIIQEHFHRKKIAKGTVISVEETQSGMVIAVVNFSGFRVIVPAGEFFAKPIVFEDDTAKQQRMRREKQLLSKSLGAEVEFIIVHASQEVNKETKTKEYVVVASRKAALEKQKKYYFGLINGGRRVDSGKIIRNVPIIAVGKERLMVSICGVDKILLKHQLSYKFIGSLVDEYMVGDKIDVAVISVKDENDEIDLVVSHKETQIEMFKQNIQNCSVGGLYRGEITIVRDNTIHLYLSDVDVPAYSKIVKLNNIDDLPSAGDSVVIVANKIVPEKGLVLGTITRIIKQ